LRIVLLALTLLLAACQGARGPDTDTLAYAAATERDPRYAAIVVDAGSGDVLYSENAEARRHPASLAKMMTLYLVFEAIDAGRLSMDAALPVSAAAAREPASKLGLKAGSSIALRDAVLAVCVRSANDAAVVMAEAVAGSEGAFVARMNAKARALGLSATHFENATGLPDSAQVTSARDMAVLALALQRDFPARYRLFSTREFRYGGKTYRSTNELLGKVAGLDGIKTGYIRASGYNLAASVKRGGKRIVIVVMGGPSGAARNAQVAALIDEHMPSGGLFASR
jgi:D-alanyl-D-alanine carboxypeptidase